jgi:hypothetical protein
MANENEEKRRTLGKRGKQNGSSKLRAHTLSTPPVLLLSLKSVIIIVPSAREAPVNKTKLVHIFQERIFEFLVADRKRSGGERKRKRGDIVEDGMETNASCKGKRVPHFHVILSVCKSGLVTGKRPEPDRTLTD